MITKLPEGVTPMVVPAQDGNGNRFEAYVLRQSSGATIYIDVRTAEFIHGGIVALRNGISPHHYIVCEHTI